jgi:flagellar basal body-associated protein FliL
MNQKQIVVIVLIIALASVIVVVGAWTFQQQDEMSTRTTEKM